MKTAYTTFLFIVCLIQSTLIFGQGFTCADAVPLTAGDIPYTYSGTTLGAGNDYTSGLGCNNNDIDGEDFVFQYISPGDEVLRVELQSLSGIDNYAVYVFDGCPDDVMTSCVAYDQGDMVDSALIQTLHFAVADTYFIVVSSWPGSASNFDFELYIDRPIGNICENAVVIPAFATDYSYVGTTEGFGDDYSDARGCSNLFISANDFVFKYTSPGDEVLRVRVKNLDSLFDFAVYVFDGCPDDPLTSCFSFDDGDWPDSAFIQTLHFDTAGTYYIVVADWDGGPDFFKFELYIDRPVGNICENAVVIPAFPVDYSFVGTTEGFGDDYGDGLGCSTTFIDANDFVFEYTSPGDEVLRVRVKNLDSLFDFGAYVFKGCPSDPTSTCFAFDDADWPDSAFIQTLHFDSAGTYYIVVADWDNGPDFYNFELYIDRPLGNICENSLKINSLPYSDINNAFGLGDDYSTASGCSNLFISANEVVYEYYAQQDAYITISLENLDQTNDFGMYLIKGCVDTSTNCVAQANGDGADSLVLDITSCLDEGLYYIVVSNYNGAGPSYNYELRVDGFTADILTTEMSGIVDDKILCFDDAGTEAVNLNAQGTGGNIATDYIYSWSTAASTQSINDMPSSSTKYTVTLTDDNGCKAYARDSISINPEVLLSINETDNSGVSNDGIICFDDAGTTSVGLTANVSGGTAGFTYLWNNTSSSTTMSISENPSSTTNYQVTITDNVGCAVSSSSMLTINNDLTSSITETDNSGTSNDGIICFDDGGIASVNLSANGSGGTSGYSYLWDDTGTSTTMSITENPNATTSYQVTVTDNVGCLTSANTMVTINTELISSITETDNSGTSNDGIICFDDAGTASVGLTANVGGGTASYSYLWNNASSSTAISISESPGTTTNYQVTVTDNVGCTILSNKIITINDQLISPITETDNSGTSNDGIVCFDDAGIASVNLTANGSGGTSGYSYLWDDAGTSTTMSITENPTNTTNYQVTVNDAVGCVTTSGSVVEINSEILVSAMAYENAGRTIPEDTLCFSNAGTQAVYFSSNASGGAGGYNYLWDNPSATAAMNMVDMPTMTRTYEVVMTDMRNCTAAAQTTIVVNPEITLNVMATENSSTPNDDQICPRDAGVASVSIMATVDGGTNSFNYQWDNPAMSTTTSIVETPAVSTIYSVTVSESSANLACQVAANVEIVVDYRTNSWIGPSTGNWNAAASNWSLGRLPDDCDHVIIPVGSEVSIQSGMSGSAYTLVVENGAQLFVPATANLIVIAPD